MKSLLLAVSVLVALWGGPAAARTIEQQVLASLEEQGYQIIEHGYTFLGRLRIIAENGLYHREIVVNPGTGEILRDYAVTLPQGVARAQPSKPSRGKSQPTVAATAADTSTGDSGVGVTMSLGAGRFDGTTGMPDTQTMDVVLPESLLQMDPGAP